MMANSVMKGEKVSLPIVVEGEDLRSWKAMDESGIGGRLRLEEISIGGYKKETQRFNATGWTTA